ncbi:uncharacterized protein N0V89_007789 [Didymosphaeria variabile]|uniref:Myb-like DNA-binding domain-containing protein n=1 Tax=Didymosphaeria variabile TaxID=1932322 RepID=A0A9W8XKT7_9PLEO|nr:uncharacterized protein N0V89_007789 [Didymosphaeria variabile]KAJ4352441.1 hypothetical protein N0V89_007789 [Didymosphaeria variabile]
MPTEEENIQYLYLVLTHNGTPTINWPPISTALSLSPGATSKRWSRLKKAVEEGKPAGKGSYELLWLCVKHSSRDKALDWKTIAAQCGTTSGAASKRYSRMKQAWEKEGSSDSPPATPKKAATKTDKAATPKRKRASATKPKMNGGDKFQFEPASDAEDEIESPKKRARKPKNSNIKIKSEPEGLPTPEDSSEYTAFQGFTSQGNDYAFQGFGDEGGEDEKEDETFYESNEYAEAGVNESEYF